GPELPSSQLAERSPTKISPLPPGSPSIQESVEEAGKAVMALTRRTADETVGQSRLLLTPVLADTPAEKPKPAPTTDAPAPSLEDVSQTMTAGLETVTTSARRALALFWREIPNPERGTNKTGKQGGRPDGKR